MNSIDNLQLDGEHDAGCSSRSGRLAEFLHRLREYAHLPCIESDAGSWTYGELLQEMQRWTKTFDELGISRGSVVGIRGDYSIHALASLLALLERRAIAVLVPRDGNAESYVNDAHASTLLEIENGGRYSLRSFPVSQARHPLLARIDDANDAGIVLFTSGSTGRPKAALQSCERFLYKLGSSRRSFRLLAFFLFDHIGGLDTTFQTLATGGTLIFAHRRDPDSIFGLIERYRVDVLPASPSFLRMLCVSKSRAAYDLSSLRAISYSSEPMDEGTLLRLNHLFPNARIRQKYGTTETGSPQTISRSSDSLWLKMSDGIESKVVDGQLWLRTEGAMLGYLNAPSPIKDEGWYCTGDLVEVDGEWLKVLGRKSETINVGGEKVSPVEVEQSIRQLPFVRDAVVAGLAHPVMGQVVTARVALADDIDPKAAVAKIRAHCRAHLAAFKVPVGIEISTEELTNARQKAQRRPAATR